MFVRIGSILSGVWQIVTVYNCSIFSLVHHEGVLQDNLAISVEHLYQNIRLAFVDSTSCCFNRFAEETQTNELFSASAKDFAHKHCLFGSPFNLYSMPSIFAISVALIGLIVFLFI